jgi:nucleotide-binding universal stress UspA family protein
MTMSHILVGIDGSPCSKIALRFAAEEGALRGNPLRIVCAWHVPVPLYAGGSIAIPLDSDVYLDSARASAEAEIREVLGSDGAARAELVMREGSAAPILLEESADAAMLVVGSRGRGGFSGLLLGSVSQQCAAHASCPVTIVHR